MEMIQLNCSVIDYILRFVHLFGGIPPKYLFVSQYCDIKIATIQKQLKQQQIQAIYGVILQDCVHLYRGPKIIGQPLQANTINGAGPLIRPGLEKHKVLKYVRENINYKVINLDIELQNQLTILQSYIYQLQEQKETDQRVMTLFPALNLEALRVAADTLVPRFIPAIPNIVTNFRGQQCQFKCRTNLGCVRRLFRVTIQEDEV
ncbi:Hypothetical_protein [Hexamita inflata]|uniref:Hypothetical_protein n=1 Tax=Hexamita inflata TaxID=28002 RepID=A0ABP1HZ48_9EUKA